MPDTEFAATADLSKWKMLSTEEIQEKFFKFASDNSTWVRDLYDVKDEDKEEALLCLAMIAGRPSLPACYCRREPMKWAEPEYEVVGLTWRQKFALKRIIWKAWLRRALGLDRD